VVKEILLDAEQVENRPPSRRRYRNLNAGAVQAPGARPAGTRAVRHVRLGMQMAMTQAALA
jgi:hypothetical protein